jgi:hypothetical protein
MRYLFIRPCAQTREPQEDIWFMAAMHFSYYLVIAALVVIGVQVAFALYHLAVWFL